MTDDRSKALGREVRTRPGLVDVVWQVSELVKKVYALEIEQSLDGRSFRSLAPADPRPGIRSVTAGIEDESVLRVRIEWLNSSVRIGPSLDLFWKQLSSLSERVRPLAPVQDSDSGRTAYWLELRVQATAPLGVARRAALSSEFETIDGFARTLQAELPRLQTTSDLSDLYADHTDVLRPVWPLDTDRLTFPAQLIDWAEEAVELLRGSVSLAVSGEYPVYQELAMAALATAEMKAGNSLGLVRVPSLTAKNIIELARKAPGRLVVQASGIALGTSPYDMGEQTQNLLAILASSNIPVIFVGRHQQLQSVFHGGQGGACDPLSPAVLYAPMVPRDILIRHTVESAGREAGGISDTNRERLCTTVEEALAPLSKTEQVRVLPAVTAREVARLNTTPGDRTSEAPGFAAHIAGLGETLAGLQPRPRSKRLAKVQDNLVSKLLSPDLLTSFTGELFAQDDALGELVDRLQAECLTRPDHQPIRYCAQGTPGTGKSASAALLARVLNVPHINIDAASQPDYHTASAQLLGSGRGIVGSYEAGRLEKAAKHAAGAVVEVSDLDHAPLSVRGHLADLFLQVLDTGEAQSAVGATFSCANLIFAFTINLPEGHDERIHRGIGFDGSRSSREMRARVETEIKQLFSNAFLSRIGRPILFAPLGGSELALIAEREISRSVRHGFAALSTPVSDIELADGLGTHVIASIDSGLLSHGARVVAEHVRFAATRALLRFRTVPGEMSGAKVLVSSAGDAGIKLNIVKN